MPLISENVKKNAEKCRECAFMKIRGSIDKNSVMFEEANIAVNGLLGVSCNLCPNGKEFKKVFGKMPYEYFI